MPQGAGKHLLHGVLGILGMAADLHAEGVDRVLQQADRFFHRFGGVAVQTHVGLGFQNGRHFVNDFQNQKGEIVGHVPAVFSQAGQGNELAETGGDSLIAVADHRVVGGVGVNPETFQDFLGKLPVHAFDDRALIIGPQILVNPAEGNARTGIIFIGHDKHVIYPQRLHGLPEIVCRFPGNFA